MVFVLCLSGSDFSEDWARAGYGRRLDVAGMKRGIGLLDLRLPGSIVDSGPSRMWWTFPLQGAGSN